MGSGHYGMPIVARLPFDRNGFLCSVTATRECPLSAKLECPLSLRVDEGGARGRGAFGDECSGAGSFACGSACRRASIEPAGGRGTPRDRGASVQPKSGSWFERPSCCLGSIQPEIVHQAGLSRIGGSSCRPFRKWRNASLRIRYHFRSGSNCSAFSRNLARKPAMRRYASRALSRAAWVLAMVSVTCPAC